MVREKSKSSIHFRPVKSGSEEHNMRTTNLDYIYEDLTVNNDSWQSHSIQEMESEAKKYCKKISGRKLQKNAIPIREAVVNLHDHHSVHDLKKLANEIQKQIGISCFQIHIHRDEGKEKDKINYHAHMLFRWQDMKTGKMPKINRTDLSRVQDIVAESLNMERGELRENSNRKRLEAIEYKRQQEEIKYQELQQKNADLEQKKNEVRGRVEELRRRRESAEDRIKRIEEERGNSSGATETAQKSIFDDNGNILPKEEENISEWNEKSLNRAIEDVAGRLQEVQERTRIIAEDFKGKI